MAIIMYRKGMAIIMYRKRLHTGFDRITVYWQTMVIDRLTHQRKNSRLLTTVWQGVLPQLSIVFCRQIGLYLLQRFTHDMAVVQQPASIWQLINGIDPPLGDICQMCIKMALEHAAKLLAAAKAPHASYIGRRMSHINELIRFDTKSDKPLTHITL